MKQVNNGLILLIALFHVAVMVLEMFFWNHPIGHRVFGTTAETAAVSAVLAANQGLYNGFLAAGLGWALLSDRRDLKLFFLGCIAVAGIFGGATAKLSIVFTQALPALIAWVGVWLTSPKRSIN